MSNYDDIINLPHPDSKRHPRMPLSDRAAQFSPFAALTGYDDAINETARLTDDKLELSVEQENKLNNILAMLEEKIKESPEIKILYFVEDNNKAGGAYVNYQGKVKFIDYVNRFIKFEDLMTIKFEYIYDIEFVEKAI